MRACIGLGVTGLVLFGACLGLWLSCRPGTKRGATVQVNAHQEKQALRGAEGEEPTSGAFGGVCATGSAL